MEDANANIGTTLLVVDDEAGIREVMTLALQAGGYECIAVANGQEALDACRSSEVGIHGVITDLHMPEMDGIRLVKELREIRPALPIVVSSGLMSEEDRRTFVRLGVETFLPKPYTASQLLRSVESLMCAAA